VTVDHEGETPVYRRLPRSCAMRSPAAYMRRGARCRQRLSWCSGSRLRGWRV